MQITIRNVVLGMVTTAFVGWVSSTYAVAPGFYLGANFGESNLNNKNQTLLLDPAGTTQSYKADNTGIGVRFFAGYNLNKYAAFEGAVDRYASSTFGSVAYTGYMLDPAGTGRLLPTTSVITKPAIHEYGFDLEAKGTLPAGPVGVYGKAGFAFVRKSTSGILASCSSNSMNPTPCSETSSTTNGTQSNAFRPLLAVGVTYDLSQNWVIDFSGTRITKGSGIENLNFFALGISYHFVDEYCGQFLC